VCSSDLNEVLAVGTIYSLNSDLYVYGLFNKIFLKYDNKKLMQAKITKPDSAYRYDFIANLESSLISKLIKTNNALIAQTRIPEARISILDKEGNTIKSGGKYPEKIHPDITNEENAGLYSSCIMFSNDEKKLVMATHLADMIDIYDISGDSITTVWTHQGFLPHGYEVIKMGEISKAAMTNETHHGYCDVAVSDKNIYAIFSGKTFGEKNYSFGNVIRVVSWDGVNRFELATDYEMNRLTVSSDDRYIYAIARDKDDFPVVVFYDISGLIVNNSKLRE
jgi:hypothetical protein